MSYSVIIPNKFEDIIIPLLDSIKKFEVYPRIVIVSDNHDRDYGYNHVRVDGDFVVSKSLNAGIDYAMADDVILLNDDVRLIQPTFKELQSIAYSDPSIGILAPLVDGGCASLYMQAHTRKTLQMNTKLYYCLENDRISLTCAYIKRELLNGIGKFNTQEISYGLDDDDIRVRTLKFGWKVAITSEVTIQHGTGGKDLIYGKNWNTSYARIKGSNPLAEQLSRHPNELISLLNRPSRSIKI
jgi:GT2 family glycosyltransferase